MKTRQIKKVNCDRRSSGNYKQTRKQFRVVKRIRTHGPCVSAAVLYQFSYEDPYIGSRPICILGDPGAVIRVDNEHFIDPTNCPCVSEDGQFVELILTREWNEIMKMT